MSGKLTIATDAKRVVRCTGLLRCQCGRELRAADVTLEEDEVRLVCPGCFSDLLEIEVTPCR
jgi:hypothetical protein